MKERMPSFGSPVNPVDLTAQLTAGGSVAPALAALAGSGEVDAVTLVTSLSSAGRLERDKEALAELLGRTDVPLFVFTYTKPAPSCVRILEELGVPWYTSAARAARGLPPWSGRHESAGAGWVDCLAGFFLVRAGRAGRAAGFVGFVGEVEHAELHEPCTGRGVLGAVTVLLEQCDVLVHERVEALRGVVAVRAGGLGPLAVLADVADEAVDQGKLAGDLRGAPFVQGGPVFRAEAVVVRLAQVDQDAAPPSFAAVDCPVPPR